MKSEMELAKTTEGLMTQFNELQAREKELVEQGAAIQRELNQVRANMTRASNFYEALLFAQGKDINGNPLPEKEAELVAEIKEEEEKEEVAPEDKPN